MMVPDASDDGRLVFSGTLEDQVLPGLYALYAQGGEARRLTPEGQVADSPAISPDGEWVVYSLMVDDRMRVVRSRITSSSPIEMASLRSKKPCHDRVRSAEVRSRLASRWTRP